METLLEEPSVHAVSGVRSAEGRVSYAEYRALDVDDDYFYELINGELVKKSAPSPFHQILVVNLAVALNRFTKENNLGGQILVAPVDVFVDDYSAPQPDVLYISEARRSIITSDGVMGAPDLVMEVLSPSSISRDRNDKRKLYERLKVQEYWILDPNNRSIEVYALTESGYDIAGFAVEQGTASSGVLQGFSVTVQEIMP
jgi:Uma2 family endonuclease